MKVFYDKNTNEIMRAIDTTNHNPNIFTACEGEGEIVISEIPDNIHDYLANADGIYLKPPQPHVPTEKEELWQSITQLEIDAMMTNQQLTDAELQIEILKSGGAV